MVSLKAQQHLKNTMNLNSYEAQVWKALLSRGISSAAELADISGVPRSRCYDVLQSLEKKGFVFQKIGKPIKYIANHPEEAVKILQKQVRIEQNRLQAHYENVKGSAVFDELQKLYTTGINYVDNNEISNSIVGRSNIAKFIKDMLSQATDQVTISTTKTGVKRKLKILKKANCKAKVEIRAPHKEKAPANVSFVNHDSKWRYIIAGDEALLFTTPEDISADQESAIWMKSEFLTKGLQSFIH